MLFIYANIKHFFFMRNTSQLVFGNCCEVFGLYGFINFANIVGDFPYVVVSKLLRNFTNYNYHITSFLAVFDDITHCFHGSFG